MSGEVAGDLKNQENHPEKESPAGHEPPVGEGEKKRTASTSPSTCNPRAGSSHQTDPVATRTSTESLENVAVPKATRKEATSNAIRSSERSTKTSVPTATQTSFETVATPTARAA